MSNQKLMLNLGDLAVESIEVVPATSLDPATYGHGIHELAASSEEAGYGTCSCGSCAFMSDELDEV